jgi:hypothetical protein
MTVLVFAFDSNKSSERLAKRHSMLTA